MSIPVSSSSNLSTAAIRGATWRYITFFSSKAVLLISTVVLARILTKEEFGIVGFAITTIGFLEILSDMGIGPAVIYYSEDRFTSSTAFWLNLLISIGLFGVAWILAPSIASYFRDERATSVIRILAITFPIIALGHIHQKLLEKKLAFNRTFIPELLRSLTKGGTSIGFAFLGYGAWSLIFGQICGEIIATVAYWVSMPWAPGRIFEWGRARSLLDYGIKYVGADAIAVLLLNLDYLLVGRYLGAEALGVYTIAFRLPDLLVLQFARTLSGVIFPIYSRMRETSRNIGRGFLLTTRYISVITVPMGLGLALVAMPLTKVVFSEKWIEVVPAIQGIAIYALLLSLAYNAGGAYKASGRPQIIIWLGLVRLGLLLPALWYAVTVAGTIVAVSWMHALVALISAIISLHVAAYILSIKLNDIYSALLPAFAAGIVMTVAVIGTLSFVDDWDPLFQLILSISVGGISYLIVLWVFFRDIVVDAINRLLGALGKV